MTKILWHSNAPWVPTGYGQQTGMFCPMLAEHHDVAISSFYGLEGAPIRYDGVPVLPGLGGEYGCRYIPDHAAAFFGGDPRGGIVVTLMDVWVLDAAVCREVNMASWVPVDHEPAPEQVVDFFTESGAVPVAMSRFGERMLGRLDPLYVPHGVDTETYRPMPRDEARQGAFPEGAFVVGMIAANKGRPSRKSFVPALRAFARFAEAHDDAYLYLHTQMDPAVAGGENLPRLCRELGIMDRVRVADQYAVLFRPHTHKEMARAYGAIDVLLNPAQGEGFGIPMAEAQSCGRPVIATDHSAMREVVGAGWHVEHDPYWTGLNSWQAIPRVDDIVSALEECHALTPARREKLERSARRHALQYDARKVLTDYWLPALERIEQRLDSRSPVVVPARRKAAA